MRAIIIILTIATLVSCAVIKVPVPTGGSKADGTIEMSFSYGGFEKPKVNWDEALATAKNRCAVWGYTGAEAFGGSETTCMSHSIQYGCNAWRVKTLYQCTGQIN